MPQNHIHSHEGRQLTGEDILVDLHDGIGEEAGLVSGHRDGRGGKERDFCRRAEHTCRAGRGREQLPVRGRRLQTADSGELYAENPRGNRGEWKP